jgi:hypothetical protein
MLFSALRPGMFFAGIATADDLRCISIPIFTCQSGKSIVFVYLRSFLIDRAGLAVDNGCPNCSLATDILLKPGASRMHSLIAVKLSRAMRSRLFYLLHCLYDRCRFTLEYSLYFEYPYQLEVGNPF